MFLDPQCPGRLLAFEGIDGAGKSTAMRKVADWLRLQGYPVVVTQEPSRSPYGLELRRLAKMGRLSPEKEYELFLKDRKEHVQSVILPALKQGHWVLSDRYFWSTLAYQGARGLNLLKILRDNRAIAPDPHAWFLLSIDLALALNRIQQLRGDVPDHFEKNLSQVRDIFEKTQNLLTHVHRIEASVSKQELFENIVQIIRTDILPGVEHGDFSKG